MRLLAASQLRLSYGHTEIFSGVDFEVTDRARIGIVGSNGSGKTSLLRIIVGEMEPAAGTISRADGVRLGYAPQTPSNTRDGSLQDEVMEAFDELRRLEGELAASVVELESAEGAKRSRADQRYSSLLQQYEALGGYDYEHHMEQVASRVGLSSELLATPYAVASGGERTRAALAKALLFHPDLLVLDEPTNYLDLDGLTWLEEFLERYSGAFIVVSHDRYFLDRVVNQVWELEQRRLQIFPGNYTKYRTLKTEQIKRQRREYERQQAHIAKEQSFIQRYHAGQRAREARGRATRLQGLERVEAPKQQLTVAIPTASASRTGDIVITAHSLEVGFVDGDRHVKLLSMPDVKLERSSRTAIIGKNGSGKTTLLRTILDEMPPLRGSVTLGQNVKVGYYRQGLADLPMDSTVIDVLLDAREVPLGDLRSYLARFLFTGSDVFKLVSSLSGGERSRLALARLLISQPNVLLLDEPTTHLDIPSREALEQVLLDYDGTLLFVSHDRQLISLLAQQLWILENATARVFAGTFGEWRRSVQAPVAPIATRSKPTARRLAPTAKQQQSKGPGSNPEQAIDELEAQLQSIEHQLALASERQDVTEIVRLAEDHSDAQAKLAQAWQEWIGPQPLTDPN